MASPATAAFHKAKMRKYSDEDLLHLLVSYAEELGRAPSRREVAARGDVNESTITRRFGSYNNAIIAAGLQPRVRLPEQYLERDRHQVPLSMRYAVLQRDGFRCQYCGGTPQDSYVLHVDHKLPFSQGGKTEPANLVTACFLCNSGKNDMAA